MVGGHSLHRVLNDQWVAGELGLGPNEPKSATKPTKVQPLSGVEVFAYVLCYVF